MREQLKQAFLFGVIFAAMFIPFVACVGVSRNPDRVTAADEDWGVDVVFDESHRPQRVYIEGPPGVSLPGKWEVGTGRTVDERQYVIMERVAGDSVD
jgi:hypothetical protein